MPSKRKLTAEADKLIMREEAHAEQEREYDDPRDDWGYVQDGWWKD